MSVDDQAQERDRSIHRYQAVPDALMRLARAAGARSRPEPESSPPSPPPIPMVRPDLVDLGAFRAYLIDRLGDQGWQVPVYQGGAVWSREPAFAVAVGDEGVDQVVGETGLKPAFKGLAATGPGREKSTAITLLDRWGSDLQRAPDGFLVGAVISAYNERDVICQVLRHLVDNGVKVHLIDNWSTDGTADLVREAFPDGEIFIEKWPESGPPGQFNLTDLLMHIEWIVSEVGFDWMIYQDADEIRESPWAGVTLKDALYNIGKWGYNCIDHTVVDFRPVDDNFGEGDDLDASFRYCEMLGRPEHFSQYKAWKRTGEPILLAISGGHEVVFQSRKVFPYKFLLRHYSIRGAAHGRRKVLSERKARWNQEERARGWHTQYDGFDDDAEFLWDKDDLLSWSQPDFGTRYLIERLSGIGIPGAAGAG